MSEQARRKAHRRIKPKINSLQRKIIGILNFWPDSTYHEVTQKAKDLYGKSYNPITISSRLSELEKKGLINRTLKGPCKCCGDPMTRARLNYYGREAFLDD